MSRQPRPAGKPADYRARFQVEPGAKPKLVDIDAGFCDRPLKKEDAQVAIDRNRARLTASQTKLYAEARQSVLVILQGLDASGKDGLVTHIIGALNPLSCTVTSFKAPSAVELAHDFLWRHHLVTPARGWVGIFNRSWYEAVLVERVHDLVPKKTWSRRYDRINEFERMLADSGTTIVKIFLTISREEQLARFAARLDDPLKQWKIDESDYQDRNLWGDFCAAYEDVFAKCSTTAAPWYVVPSDHKWFRNLAVSQILADTMDEMHIEAPTPHVDLDEIRRKYLAE